MASETSSPTTAADICQRHIDNIEGRRPKSPLQAALAAAVLDLLVLTRNTDVAGRANRAEIDRELGRIRTECWSCRQQGLVCTHGGGG